MRPTITGLAALVAATTIAIGAVAVPPTSAEEPAPPTPQSAETDAGATLAASAEQAVEGLTPSAANTIVQAVDALAAVDGLAESVADNTSARSDGSTVTSANGVTVVAPANAGDPVAIATPSGPPVTMELPVPAATAATVIDGLSVYPTRHGAVTQSATDTGGSRTSFVLNDANAPTSYPVDIQAGDGGSLVLEPDGSVTIRNPDGSVSSGLAAPWAKDADQNPVPTHYTIEGNTVTQHIDTTNVTAWPVVADPFWTSFSRYTRCILGVGVPIGAAWAFVAYIGGWAGLQVLATNYSARYVPGPPWLGPLVRRYGRAVYNNCRLFVLYG